VPGFFGAYGKKTEPGRLAGWGASLKRTRLHVEFPVKQGKYREFCRIGRQSAARDHKSLAVLNRLRIKFPNHRNREFLR
jgi:hypothetical protein